MSRRVVIFDETGEERAIRGGCHRCRVTPADVELAQLVSPSGLVHYAEGGDTVCGFDATGSGWWWRW